MSLWNCRSAALALAFMSLPACGGDDSSTASPASAPAATASTAAPRVSLSAQERARIPEVLAERRGTHFSRAVMVRENARVFLFLAETEPDADIATAALQALATTWTHTRRYEAQLQLLTPDYASVVSRRLDDERPAVQAAAMQAAIKCLLGDEPVRPVADHLARLATRHRSAAGRHEALEALWNSSEIGARPDQIEPFVRALDADEAWLVSGALFRLSGFGAAWPEQAALRAKLRDLLRHPDPGVRGRAATTLSNVVGPQDPQRDELSRAILSLLDDPHPFPRSAAATALAWLDYRPAVPELLRLLDDHAANTYDLRGYARLDGSPGWSHHDGSPWSRVDDAALRALQSFSSRVGPRFSFEVRQERLDQDLALAARTARAWYDTARSELEAAAPADAQPQ